MLLPGFPGGGFPPPGPPSQERCAHDDVQDAIRIYKGCIKKRSMSCLSYKLTKHAKQRARERNIPADELQQISKGAFFRNEVVDPVDCKVITIYKEEWTPPKVPCKHDERAVACPSYTAGSPTQRHPPPVLRD